MSITPKPSAADLLKRQLAKTKRGPAAPIRDTSSQTIGRQLQSRGIAQVPGLPEPEAPKWYEESLEALRHNEQVRRQQEAQQRAADALRTPPPTAAGIVRNAIAGNPLPLNGTGVLKAALAGGFGTVNGGST